MGFALAIRHQQPAEHCRDDVGNADLARRQQARGLPGVDGEPPGSAQTCQQQGMVLREVHALGNHVCGRNGPPRGAERFAFQGREQAVRQQRDVHSRDAGDHRQQVGPPVRRVKADQRFPRDGEQPDQADNLRPCPQDQP